MLINIEVAVFSRNGITIDISFNYNAGTSLHHISYARCYVSKGDRPPIKFVSLRLDRSLISRTSTSRAWH